MADEIIILEGNGEGDRYSYVFYYPIPANKRIEIGGSGSGNFPVYSPAPSDPTSVLYQVLTQDERNALDAGEAGLFYGRTTINPAQTPAQQLQSLQDTYAAKGPVLLAEYEARFKYIGQRFDGP